MDRVRTLVPGVVFANVGPTTFVAEPEYAALCDYADHHRTLDEMILEEQLPRMGSRWSRSSPGIRRSPATSCTGSPSRPASTAWS